MTAQPQPESEPVETPEPAKPETELVYRQGFGWVERPVLTRTLSMVDPL